MDPYENIIFLTTDAKGMYLHSHAMCHVISSAPVLKLFVLQKPFNPKNVKSLLRLIKFTAENLSNQFKVALKVVTKIAKVLSDLF